MKLFMDSANLDDIINGTPPLLIDGYTTNPTLMKKAGVTDYEKFAKEIIKAIPDLPISFEVITDDLPTMKNQARQISSWGSNVFVKIPIMTTTGISTTPIIRELTEQGIKLNITAVMTIEQVFGVRDAIMSDFTDSIISIFAGRIADTGRDPIPTMKDAVMVCRNWPNIKILWASPREVLNIYQAEECGCHIITATPDLIAKLHLKNKNLNEFSRETVQMFFDDAKKAGLSL